VLRYGERRVPRSRELTASALICARSANNSCEAVLGRDRREVTRRTSPPWKRHWKPATGGLSQNALIAPGL